MVLSFGRKVIDKERNISAQMEGSGSKVNELGLKMLIALSMNVLICIQVMFPYHFDECLSLMMF